MIISKEVFFQQSERKCEGNSIKCVEHDFKEEVITNSNNFQITQIIQIDNHLSIITCFPAGPTISRLHPLLLDEYPLNKGHFLN